MPDRVGQVWEFNDGMIFLVIRSREDEERDVFSHDVLVLHDGNDNDGEFLHSGMISDDWTERRGGVEVAWERPENHDERWRL